MFVLLHLLAFPKLASIDAFTSADVSAGGPAGLGGSGTPAKAVSSSMAVDAFAACADRMAIFDSRGALTMAGGDAIAADSDGDGDGAIAANSDGGGTISANSDGDGPAAGGDGGDGGGDTGAKGNGDCATGVAFDGADATTATTAAAQQRAAAAKTQVRVFVVFVTGAGAMLMAPPAREANDNVDEAGVDDVGCGVDVVRVDAVGGVGGVDCDAGAGVGNGAVKDCVDDWVDGDPGEIPAPARSPMRRRPLPRRPSIRSSTASASRADAGRAAGSRAVRRATSSATAGGMSSRTLSMRAISWFTCSMRIAEGCVARNGARPANI